MGEAKLFNTAKAIMAHRFFLFLSLMVILFICSALVTQADAARKLSNDMIPKTEGGAVLEKKDKAAAGNELGEMKNLPPFAFPFPFPFPSSDMPFATPLPDIPFQQFPPFPFPPPFDVPLPPNPFPTFPLPPNPFPTFPFPPNPFLSPPPP